MKIYGFNKTTLLDYPGHLAATIFLGNCNFRCPFCHNAPLVLNPDSQPAISMEHVLTTLEKRRNILEGVCITGGEPTVQKDLPSFIIRLKSLGFKIKLDTNGNNPAMLEHLISQNLIDYIAMDVKNCKEKYSLSIGISDFDLSNICKSIEIIMNSGFAYEFRTTVVRELHEARDFKEIGMWLDGARAYYLQSFQKSENTILSGLSAYNKNELLGFKEILDPYINLVEIRGLD